MLTAKELTRYSRNILLNQVGRKGQEKLNSARVTVVGAGGLGSPVLLYLAAAGVGNLRIIDSDNVDLTNLQRQILYTENSIGNSKVYEARERLFALNPFISIEIYHERLNESNIQTLLSGSDIIIEGSDNFETKFLVNDACFLLNIPLLMAGIFQFEGQIIGIKPNETHCYRCIFNSIPEDHIPNCSEAGVIGSVAGIVGSILSNECIKFILSLDDSIFKSILVIDSLNLEFRKIPIKKNKNCPLCGHSPTIKKITSSIYQNCEA